MTWDAKDRAILKANALIGYCQSAPHLVQAQKPEIERWVAGLLPYVENARKSIDDIFSEAETESGSRGRPVGQ